jgi:hypothetical protein
MAKTTGTKIIAIIALAVTILSLSVLAQAQAAVGDVTLPPHGRRDIPDAGDFSQAKRVHDGGGGGSNNNGNHHGHHKSHSNHGITSTAISGDSSTATTIPSTDDQALTVPLEVVNATVFRNADTYDVIGKVVNNGAEIANVVVVNVQYFDSQDNLLGESSDGADGIPPGQSKAFKISAVPAVIEGMPISMIDHYTITATEMK